MPTPQRILAIFASHELFVRIEPLLSRSTLDVSSVTSGKSSLVLLGNLAYDLILVEHPLPDLDLGELLFAMRTEGSPSVASPVLVVTRHDPAALERLAADPLLTCRSLDDGADVLQAAASRRLGVALRQSGRLLVQLQVEMGPARILRACQTVNLSETGMLLRSARLLPVGTEMTVEFGLPGEQQRIVTGARVVRHTDPEAEGPAGLGIVFEGMGVDDQRRLAAFIAGHQTT